MTIMNTADAIRGLRERLDLTQVDFARLIGVTRRHLIRWEQGRVVPRGPARAMLTALQNALDEMGVDDEVDLRRLVARELKGSEGLAEILQHVLVYAARTLR